MFALYSLLLLVARASADDHVCLRRPSSSIYVGIGRTRAGKEASSFEPLAISLSQHLGLNVSIVDLTGSHDFSYHTSCRSVDFLFSDPLHASCLGSEFRYSTLATATSRILAPSGLYTVKTANSGGTIITRPDSDIATFADLRGRVIALSDPGSLNGLPQLFAAQRAGVALFSEARELLLVNRDALIVYEVLRGRADAGFIDPAVLFHLQARGAVHAGDYRIIEGEWTPDGNIQTVDPYLPDLAFQALPHVSETLKKQVALALLSLTSDEVQGTGLDGFVSPSEYGRAWDLQDTMRLRDSSTGACVWYEDKLTAIELMAQCGEDEYLMPDLMNSCGYSATDGMCPGSISPSENVTLTLRGVVIEDFKLEYLCVCRPCRKVRPSGSLSPLLLTVVIIACVLGALLILFLSLYTRMRYKEGKLETRWLLSPDRLILLETLARGTYSTVYSASLEEYGTSAVKIFYVKRRHLRALGTWVSCQLGPWMALILSCLFPIVLRQSIVRYIKAKRNGALRNRRESVQFNAKFRPLGFGTDSTGSSQPSDKASTPLALSGTARPQGAAKGITPMRIAALNPALKSLKSILGGGNAPTHVANASSSPFSPAHPELPVIFGGPSSPRSNAAANGAAAATMGRRPSVPKTLRSSYSLPQLNDANQAQTAQAQGNATSASSTPDLLPTTTVRGNSPDQNQPPELRISVPTVNFESVSAPESAGRSSVTLQNNGSMRAPAAPPVGAPSHEKYRSGKSMAALSSTDSAGSSRRRSSILGVPALLNSNNGAGNKSSSEFGRAMLNHRFTSQGRLPTLEGEIENPSSVSRPHGSVSARLVRGTWLSARMNQLCDLRHTHIVSTVGACVSTESGGVLSVHLVTEKLEGGTLASLLQNAAVNLNLELKLNLLVQTAEGLVYLHSRSPPFAHGNLGPSKLFLDSTNLTKIGGFPFRLFDPHAHKAAPSASGRALRGLGFGGRLMDAAIPRRRSVERSNSIVSRWLDEQHSAYTEQTRELQPRSLSVTTSLASVGSNNLMFVAPEVLRGEFPTPAADVYSFALVVWTVFARQNPFAQISDRNAFLAGLEKGLRPPLDARIPSVLHELLDACWSKNPSRRPPATEVLRRLKAIMRHPSVQTLLAAEATEETRQASRLKACSFPKRIQDALRKGLVVRPQNFSSVTVLILDFSSKVQLLHRNLGLPMEQILFSLHNLTDQLDAMLSDLNLFRIQSLDTLLVLTANIAEPQNDHAYRCLQYGLKARRTMNKKLVVSGRPDLGTWSCITAIGSGSAVCSVEGDTTKRFLVTGEAMSVVSLLLRNAGDEDMGRVLVAPSSLVEVNGLTSQLNGPGSSLMAPSQTGARPSNKGPSAHSASLTKVRHNFKFEAHRTLTTEKGPVTTYLLEEDY